jgi:hypothetical protein
VTNPIYSQFICCPAILRDADTPRGWEFSFIIPGIEVSFPCNNDIRQDCIPNGTDCLDNCNPFPITRLDRLCFCPSVGACHNYSSRNNSYHKASLVEVIDIRLTNRVLGNCILHKLKPAPNNLWIFVFSPLIVVLPLKTCLELWSSSYKIPSLSWSDAFALTRRDNAICYFFYNTKSRRESF